MSVLQRIVAAKRDAVAQRKARRPLSSLKRGLAPSRRSLRDEVLRGPGPGLILECKKASPSRGLIRPDFDPVAIARTYEPFAAGISVLADEPFFQGSLDFVHQVAEAVRAPVLCKDFVVDPYQIWEARALGADAILLMASVLGSGELERCHDVAESLGMDALLEVHDEAELERALTLGAPLLGINSRDLKTLEVDLAVTERLARQVGPEAVLIGESGILSHADVRRLRSQVDGFLVGSALMSRPDLGQALRELCFGRVKVCGLTRPEDALAAWEAGACWGGLIFAPRSKRFVTRAQASLVQKAAPQLRWAGVFVNEPLDELVATARALELDAIQLHGDEDRAFIEALRAALEPGVELWKAHSVRPGTAEEGLPSPEALGVERVLLDTFSPKQRGGSGRSFEWAPLERLSPDARQGTILAGGLKPDNARRAEALGLWALDVNSGVEDAPGRKSHPALGDFFAAQLGERRERP